MSRSIFPLVLVAAFVGGMFFSGTSRAGIYFVATRSASIYTVDSEGNGRIISATFYVTAPGRDNAATEAISDDTARTVAGRDVYKFQFARFNWSRVPLSDLDAVRPLLAEDIGHLLTKRFEDAHLVLEQVEVDGWQDAAYCHI